MTKINALLKRLEELVKHPDQEMAHVEADRALLEYIGDVKVREMYAQVVEGDNALFSQYPKAITTFDAPDVMLDSQYGTISYAAWLSKEKERLAQDGIVTQVVQVGGRVCLTA